MLDYVVYVDTDSLFIDLNRYLFNKGVPMRLWDKLDQKKKSEYLLRISKVLEKNIGSRMFDEVQTIDYNSSVPMDVFSIGFKQEIVCKSVIFIAPKMYSFHVINNEGFDCDKIDNKGIEVVRSTSPSVFRAALTDIIKRLLNEEGDDTLIELIEKYKKDFYNSCPEDMSINVSANNISKYVDADNMYQKGTPYNIKGVSHYHRLLKEFNIDSRYPMISEGDKCKFIYLKPNRYGIDSITYYQYPKEFIDRGVVPDYSKMIEKYFDNKISIILDPIKRSDIINGYSTMDSFF